MIGSSNHVQDAMLRIDYGRVDQYTRPEPPKRTFLQKVGGFFGSLFKAAAPIVSLAVPGIGLPIAAGMYGLGNMTTNAVRRSEMKAQIAHAQQPQPTQVTLPGFFDQVPMQAGNQVNSFSAPQEFYPSIGDVILERNQAHQSSLKNFSM